MGDRLRFVFRNFPLIEIHPHALAAAQLAEGAAEIGRFWTAHDLLFENQAALGEIDLFDFGERVGLDSSAVSRALDGRFDERIRGDFLGGVRSGVNGTPCLFINGSRYDGRNELDALIDALGKAAVQSRRAS
jgi:protein-disulfide isomerase